MLQNQQAHQIHGLRLRSQEIMSLLDPLNQLIATAVLYPALLKKPSLKASTKTRRHQQGCRNRCQRHPALVKAAAVNSRTGPVLDVHSIMRPTWISATLAMNHEWVLALYREPSRKLLDLMAWLKRRLNPLLRQGIWDGSVGFVGHSWSINGGRARGVAR